FDGATLSGTPPLGSSNLDLRFVATDPSGAQTALPFRLVIEGPANSAPTASDTSVTTDEDSALVGTLPAAVDADADAVSYALAGAATHGTAAVNADGTYTYTPNSNFAGSDSFGYSVSDGRGGSNSYVVSVAVAPVNDAPVAADVSVTLAE